MRDKVKKHKNLDTAKAFLVGLNTGKAPAVVLDSKLLNVGKLRAQSDDKILRTNPSPGMGRVRTAQGKEFACRAYDVFPEESNVCSKAELHEALQKGVRLMGPGPIACIGRLEKYFPKRNRSAPIVPSPGKVKHVMKVLGMDLSELPNTVLKMYPFVKTDDQNAIRISSKSSNGLPTLGRSDDAADLEVCLALAVDMENQMLAAYAAGGDAAVRNWVRAGQKEQPHMWTILGAAKSEFMSNDKIDGLEARYYNVWPRWMMMVMQRVTQPFEDLCTNILLDTETHNAQGVSLAHAGAAQLVRALRNQLDGGGKCYSVCGDDTWLIIRDELRTHMLALDGSSFDITNLSEFMTPYLLGFKEQLALFSKAHASFWYHCQTFRQVNMLSSLVRTMKDTNPSGGTLVSKLNSCFMADGVEELLTTLMGQATVGPLSEEGIAEEVEAMGKRRGWTLKLEQYRTGVDDLEDMLRDEPFLYLGYYFHRRGAGVPGVQVALDPKRWIVHATAPPGENVKGEELAVLEAMRLGGIAVNLGIPPAELDASYTAVRSYATELLAQVRSDARFAQFLDAPQDKWEETPVVGVPTPKDVVGMYNAVLTAPFFLWGAPRPPPPPPSANVPSTWGEEQDDEEDEIRAERGAPAPPLPGPPTHPKRSTKVVKSDKPVTAANDGRPPPTKKEKKPAAPKPSVARVGGPRVSKAAAAAEAAQYDSEMEQSEEEEYYDAEDDDQELSDGEGAPAFEVVDEDEQANLFNAGAIARRRSQANR